VRSRTPHSIWTERWAAEFERRESTEVPGEVHARPQTRMYDRKEHGRDNAGGCSGSVRSHGRPSL
jgi:hypothetical protein